MNVFRAICLQWLSKAQKLDTREFRGVHAIDNLLEQLHPWVILFASIVRSKRKVDVINFMSVKIHGYFGIDGRRATLWNYSSLENVWQLSHFYVGRWIEARILSGPRKTRRAQENLCFRNWVPRTEEKIKYIGEGGSHYCSAPLGQSLSRESSCHSREIRQSILALNKLA